MDQLAARYLLYKKAVSTVPIVVFVAFSAFSIFKDFFKGLDLVIPISLSCWKTTRNHDKQGGRVGAEDENFDDDDACIYFNCVGVDFVCRPRLG